MRFAPALVLIAFWLAPALAQACSVCSGGEDQSRMAFIVTTVLLSVLPPAMVGGLVFWIRSRARMQDARHSEPAHWERSLP